MRKKLEWEKVKRISKEKGIPILHFEKTFNCVSGITTSKQAADVFNDVWLFYCKTRKSAFKKWNQLSIQEVKAAKTREQIIEVSNHVSSESKAGKIATKKLNKLALIEVEKAVTIEETKIALEHAPDKSKAQKAALIKIYELSE